MEKHLKKGFSDTIIWHYTAFPPQQSLAESSVSHIESTLRWFKYQENRLIFALRYHHTSGNGNTSIIFILLKSFWSQTPKAIALKTTTYS